MKNMEQETPYNIQFRRTRNYNFNQLQYIIFSDLFILN